MRQWILLSPIPLCLLLAGQPKPATPVLQVVRRVITRPAPDLGIYAPDRGGEPPHLLECVVH